MKNRSATVIIGLILIASLFSSCNGGNMFKKYINVEKLELFLDDRKQAKSRLDELINAIVNEDRNKIKSMFADSVAAKVEDFDAEIDCLIDYYQGNMLSYDDWGGPDGDITWDNGSKVEFMYSSFDIKTDKDDFRLAVTDCVRDSDNPQNVGLHSLYIIRKDDDTDPDFAYGNFDEPVLGINIGIKNNLPKEEVE